MKLAKAMRKKQKKMSLSQRLSWTLSQLTEVKTETGGEIILAPLRTSLIIKFDKQLQFKLIKVAQALEDVGFRVETILDKNCCMFVTCLEAFNHEEVLRDVPQIVSWSVDN